MKDFMNTLWNATGAFVTGYYKSGAFIGRITDIRAKFGTDLGVTITVDLEESDCDYATLLVDGSTLHAGGGRGFENLRVYF